MDRINVSFLFTGLNIIRHFDPQNKYKDIYLKIKAAAKIIEVNRSLANVNNLLQSMKNTWNLLQPENHEQTKLEIAKVNGHTCHNTCGFSP